MMTARVAGPHVARVMGIIVVPVLIGPILGPVLAGSILQNASWRWIFFINLPIGILATLLAMWILPRDQASSNVRSFDLRGVLLLSPGLALLLYSLENFSGGSEKQQLRWWILATSLFLLTAFVVHAKRSSEA